MCGIIGYLGNHNTKEIVFNSLLKLEYRGYDSAGIAYQDNQSIVTIKHAGSIQDLKNSITSIPSNCAIAHTRWATHGRVNKENAHPHTSENLALVHNGIIDNYKQLKSKFSLTTISETDSEVIAKLINFQINNFENHPKISKKDQKNIKNAFLVALQRSCDQIIGSYALAILHDKSQDTIYITKRQSPLYVAKTTLGMLISSDISVFENIATTYYELNDNEYGIVKNDKVIFYDQNLNQITKNEIKLKLELIPTRLGDYPYYMIKEINDIPNALSHTLSHYENDIKIPTKLLKNIESVHFIGCGTAYHSGLMGVEIMKKVASLPAYAHIASEFLNEKPLLDKKGLYIFISQSGETADTLTALRQVKKHKKVIAITNVLHSTIAKEANYLLPICAGKELAVASTKAYNCQILVMQILAKLIKNTKKHRKNTKITLKNAFFDKIRHIIASNEIMDIAKKMANKREVFFIGKGEDLVSAYEASLKLKEITYINSFAMPAGELKHGTLALIDTSAICFVILTNPKYIAKIQASISEIQARGGVCYLITQLDVDNIADYTFKLPTFNYNEITLSSIIFFQLLAYHTSIIKGFNPDKPRNLAKSVTVG